MMKFLKNLSIIFVVVMTMLYCTPIFAAQEVPVANGGINIKIILAGIGASISFIGAIITLILYIKITK